MVKFICDGCENQIKAGEMTAEFKSLEYDVFKKHKTPNGIIESNYLFCQNCRDEVKKSIVELTEKKKNEQK